MSTFPLSLGACSSSLEVSSSLLSVFCIFLRIFGVLFGSEKLAVGLSEAFARVS